ncbi:MAG: hypothetical protein V3V13_14205 [Paracoccaceae bacterium]
MLKRLKKLGTIVLFTGLFGGTVAHAAAVRIECPLDKARTEITSPLPSGWWQTPQVGRLQETKLGNVGGDATLMCGYWAYGQSVFVLMKAPVGMDCTADATGFSCASGGVVAPQTYRTGLISLKQTWMMDLDNGTTGGRAGADIFFHAATKTQRFLEPVNGAQIALAGNRSINLAGCRNLAGYTSGPLPLELFREGMYVCVKTDEGRISQFRVNTAAGASPGTMEIGFTTWAN